MTLENCRRLLKHYNDLADGTIEKPFGHKDWADVVHNAKLRAKVMEERIAHKLNLLKYANEPEAIAKRKKEEEKVRKEEEKRKKEVAEKAKAEKEKKDAEGSA